MAKPDRKNNVNEKPSFDEVVKRMLITPPQPKKDKEKNPPKSGIKNIGGAGRQPKH